ncbi:hypothetical protein EXN66_Car012973 [Channa argus]|uniref:Uncharacterized protein n=1 Tax=Channa argus TaxID=215402 RepID=A0A6G1Q4K8_CHAAH|nr:hypothetical protein EXN66_Car012973 [Channa argus]
MPRWTSFLLGQVFYFIGQVFWLLNWQQRQCNNHIKQKQEALQAACYCKAALINTF